MSRANPMTPRLVAVVLLCAACVLFVRCGSCRSASMRIGTYNIRRLGVEPTDMSRLAAIVRETETDVLALQEVQRAEKVKELATSLSVGGRRFEFVLSKCGGPSEMSVGFLFDAARVTLQNLREYPALGPPSDACSDERSGLSATFVPARGRPFQLLVTHLIAGGGEEKQERRREQWRRAHHIARELGKEGPVAILGDTNSTGFLGDKGGERSFILEEAERAGLDVVTKDLKCTEYFHPEGQAFLPSVLDHVVATPTLVKGRSLQVHSFCAELSCSPTEKPPSDFTHVSDHCPVTLDVSL